MNHYLTAAAVVSALVAAVHSVLGERLIFSKLRTFGFVPANAAPPLQGRNVRILWATWHLASVFGCGFAVILCALASSNSRIDPLILNAIVCAFAGGAMLVLFATRGRHPGWVGLSVAALLVFIGGA